MRTYHQQDLCQVIIGTAHFFNFYTVIDADEDLVHDGFVVPVRLVVPHSQHFPRLYLTVPADLYYPLIQLLFGFLKSLLHARQFFPTDFEEVRSDIPLPFLISHGHKVEKLISVASQPGVKKEFGLGAVVRLVGIW